MTTYPTLITDVWKTERTAQLVSLSIHILVKWAENRITANSYGDLIKELGMVRFSGIGYTLGCIENVLLQLGKKINEQIPQRTCPLRAEIGFTKQIQPKWQLTAVG